MFSPSIVAALLMAWRSLFTSLLAAMLKDPVGCLQHVQCPKARESFHVNTRLISGHDCAGQCLKLKVAMLSEVLLLQWTEMPPNPAFDLLDLFSGRQAVTQAWLLNCKVERKFKNILTTLLGSGRTLDTVRLALIDLTMPEPWTS